MSEKKKALKLPPSASSELKGTDCSKKQWPEEVELLVDNLAKAKWNPFSSRPRGDPSGYFVLFRWYGKEQVWVPLYMSQGNVGSRLAKLFSNRESTPICKYLSSFPRSDRKLVWVKWILDSTSTGEKTTSVNFKEVLRAFSAKYNQGELLPFNMEDEADVPDTFSLLDY